MLSFKNDYSEGAHPRILEALARTNLEQTDGYGEDPHTENACRLLREKIGCADCDVHLLCGGTQTNLTLIAHALRPHQAAVAAATGHICTHETGAIEAAGHKAFAVAAPDGKLTPALLRAALEEHTDHHMVQPKLCYISQSTETGTFYTKGELEALSAFCRANGLYLYLDGARLPSALALPACGLTLADLPRLCDAFYLGGTKCGALLGEALVIVNPALRQDFRYVMKQRGGLLAKGRVVGIQFEELLRGDLYFDLARHANAMAMRLRDAVAAEGYAFAAQSLTNQQFPVLPIPLCDSLAEHCRFEVWGPGAPGMRVIRLVTSWATTEESVEQFIELFNRLSRAWKSAHPHAPEPEV